MDVLDPAVVAAVLTRAARQDGVVTTSDLSALGLGPHVPRRLVRAGQWERLLRGAYLVRPGRVGVQRVRAWSRAASLVVPGAVAGRSSASHLLGVQGAPVPAGAEVVLPPGRQKPSRPGLAVVVSALAPQDVVDVRGVATTSALRTLVDLVPRLDRPAALSVLDSALALGLVTPEDLLVARERCAGRRGSSGAADLWVLADGRAESPLESRARLACVEAGVPPDDLQVVVRTGDGHVVARGDLGFHRRSRPERRLLLLECDGKEVHAAPDALYRDRWRANALVALGVDVIRCTWADVEHPGRLPAMVRAAL
ncbi:type IV toxin-antitoxin system AbiEi family antitoxin domain-containing protein [uncultured Pseudokineococcus sp.]|uniref:type IV toxin-antitoxin system AbiEi family antitoxin domain-containing protein n=1 Tax=uncultured Pseudokineococcus sp. TaxID=1642928 RepID=UPI002623428C|nr:type IV toxin-antitoxin system AbiEi family antitoxin domain-containing protein [uncultured Pseudokineococcus sp.]